VAVLPSGEVLVDSWDITRHSRLPPISSPDQQAFLDEKLGPLARVVLYSYILHPQHRRSFDTLCTADRSNFWKLLWNANVGNTTHGLLTKLFQPNNATVVSQAKEELDRVFIALGDRIQHRSTPYLAGEQIGVEDIATASLAALVLFPSLYCEGRYTSLIHDMIESDMKMKEEVERYRSTILGHYCLELYDKHRLV
jgi:hypothetical protein